MSQVSAGVALVVYAERKQVSTGCLDSMWTNFVTSLKIGQVS